MLNFPKSQTLNPKLKPQTLTPLSKPPTPTPNPNIDNVPFLSTLPFVPLLPVPFLPKKFYLCHF